MTDTVVIGAGLAGLTTAIRLAQADQSVTLLTKGIGGIQLGQGTIDVLGYVPTKDGDRRVEKPFEEWSGFVAKHPAHPYRHLDNKTVRTAVDWLAGLLPGLLLPGDGRNQLVPTAVGAMRPTYLVQPSMAWPEVSSIAVVGPRQIKDFYPELVAANLAQTAKVQAKGYHIDLPARPGEVDSSPLLYALALDDADFRADFAKAVAAAIGDESAVCLPAILGLRTPDVAGLLAEALGRPVVEVLMVPPSIPGMRLNEALTALAKSLSVRIIIGAKVTSYQATPERLEAVVLHQAGYDKEYRADNFVYAPGGFESGALRLDSYGQATETLFGLPLTGVEGSDLVNGDYWADQQLFAAGVAVDDRMRPLDIQGQPFYQNLYAAGGVLAGAIRWHEKSGDAIAVASAVRSAEAILGLYPAGAAKPKPKSPAVRPTPRPAKKPRSRFAKWLRWLFRLEGKKQ